MERENNKKKRAREPSKKQPQEPKPKPKPKRQQQQKKREKVITTAAAAAAVAGNVSPARAPAAAPAPSELGVFEFPWQKEERPIGGENEGCDLRDVFFSSLVDGCSAAIGFPGDRISPLPAPIVFPEGSGSWQPDDGVDCIWSCALREPLPVYSKASRLA